MAHRIPPMDDAYRTRDIGGPEDLARYLRDESCRRHREGKRAVAEQLHALRREAPRAVEHGTTLCEDAHMEARAVRFDDGSVYVTVRLREERRFSFTALTIEQARALTHFLHPRHAPRKNDALH